LKTSAQLLSSQLISCQRQSSVRGKTLNSLIQNKFPPFRNNCSNSGLIQPERNQAGSPASAQNYGKKKEGNENEEHRA
jgi:hypothetical protein